MWQRKHMSTAIAALALGFSWLLSFAAYDVAVYKTLPEGYSLSEPFVGSWVRAFSPFGATTTYIVALLAPVLLVVAWCLVEEWLEVDPRRLCFSSLRWTGRAIAQPFILFVFGLFLALVVAWYWWEPMFWAVGGFALLGVFLVSFVLLAPEFVGAEDPPRAWVPRWPGAMPLLMFFTVLSLFSACEWLLCLILDCDSPVGWAGLLSLQLDMAAMAASAAVLVYRLGPADALGKMRAALSWPRLSPFLALEARSIYLVLFFTPAAFLFTIFLLKNAPVSGQWLELQGLEQPVWVRALEAGAGWFRDYFLLAIIFPATVFVWMVVGRLAWVVGRAR